MMRDAFLPSLARPGLEACKEWCRFGINAWSWSAPGQKRVHYCILAFAPQPPHPSILLLCARPPSLTDTALPYLKFPDTFFGNVSAVCQECATSVGSDVEAIGRQHREQVASLKFYTEVEGEFSPRAEGAKRCY